MKPDAIVKLITMDEAYEWFLLQCKMKPRRYTNLLGCGGNIKEFGQAVRWLEHDNYIIY